MLLTPMGSAGDVYPFVGLALALQARGARITFVVSGYFQELIERVGLEYVELGTREQFLELAEHPDLWHPARSFSYLFTNGVRLAMRPQYEIIAEHHTPGQTIVIGSCLGFGARIAQEKLAIPLVTVNLQPAVMWSQYESPALPGVIAGAPRWLKRVQYWMGEKILVDRTACPETNRFRRELGLPPMRRTTRWWHSPQCVVGMFPEWYAPPQPDWPPHVSLAGFPLWDRGHAVGFSGDVEEFLNAGDPPLVFTPGSAYMYGDSFFREAVAACLKLGRRGMLVSPFRERVPANLPTGVRHFDYVPFSRLFPRAAAVVHHGGIGTTALALAAGVPQLIMPMAHDQPDNAARVKRLGVGDWLRPAGFRAAEVAGRLQQLIASPEIRDRCRQIAGRIRPGEGLETACEIIERFARQELPQHATATQRE